MLRTVVAEDWYRPKWTSTMRQIRGHYNGSVVVLDEAAPVDHEVDVLIEFPDEATRDAQPGEHPLVERWRQSQARLKGVGVSVSQEVIRQRRME